MGELTGTLNSLLNAELLTRLKKASVIELNYTSRLKNNSDQWILELRCNGMTEAIAHKIPNLDCAESHAMMKKEAEDIKQYLKALIAGFNAKITGYYFHGNIQKEKIYGRLT